jgi:amino acid permease
MFLMMCALVEMVQRMMVNWVARCRFGNGQTLTNLDTSAGPVPFLPHESIGTLSVCIVSMGQIKIMSWLPQACF